MKARIIAVEGIDQSGKRTQARLLAKKLGRLGYKVATASFPIYKSFSGRHIADYLNGKATYSFETLHMLYSLNRWENLEQIQKLLHNHNFLIADRYTPSNLAYGVSRGLEISWLDGLDRGLPRADLIIVLDASVPSSFARKTRGRDAHESNRQFLAKVRLNYQALAKRLGWKTVDASGPVRQIEAEVWEIVRKQFQLPKTFLQKT